MKRKAALNLSVSFLVIIIICIAIFSFSIYFLKKFFTHAEEIKMVYDERTEKEIERILDDGSRVAIPFDKKTIYNGEFKTFGIGVLNMLNTGPSNNFEIYIYFNKAYDKENTKICEAPNPCWSTYPNDWLIISSGTQDSVSGVTIPKIIKNNEQEKFLLGVEPKNALPGIYIFDLMVCVDAGAAIEDDTSKCPGSLPDPYDNLHKLYVEVP